jgi:ABC-type Na+ efflux pump permease subunit
MNPTLTIVSREFKCFAGSDRGVFVVYGILVVLWSLLYLSRSAAGGEIISLLWAMTFAAVVGGNFAQTTFLAERMNGALEILLACGISRRAIVAGKTIFIVAMTIVIGFACLGLAALWSVMAATLDYGAAPIGAEVFVVYGAAAFLNAAMSCWFSVVLPNPRVLHFINLGFTLSLVALFYLATGPLHMDVHAASFLLTAILLAGGALFIALGIRAFSGERVIAPVTL